MEKLFFAMTFLMGLVLTQCVHTKNTELSSINNYDKTKNQHSMDNKTKVLIKTDLGDVVLVLYDETPKHRDNFIQLVESHYYDSVLFHRVIQNFMIQTGDPNSKNAKSGESLGHGGPNYTITAEFNQNLIHKRGAVAAARQGDNVNPQKASSGSQFYIVDGRLYSKEELGLFISKGIFLDEHQIETYTTIGGAPHLDNNYTVFGEVIQGMDIVDKIAASAVDRNNRPLNDIKIISMSIIK